VFDKDDADQNAIKVKNFEDAFTISKAQNFQIAYSNEAFELWLLLHFIDVDRETAIPRQEIYRLLKEEFQKIAGYEDYEYNHRKYDKRTLEIVFKAGNREVAIQRAETLEKYHKKSPPIKANPTTRVHILIRELLAWIKYYSYKPKRI